MILFLDDDTHRTTAFLRKVPNAICTTTAEGMIDLLKKHAWALPIEYLFLDHDLGNETWVDPDREDTGSEVVRWITKFKPPIKEIYVHTHNTIQGPKMEEDLEKAGYKTNYVPFARLLELIQITPL